MSYILDALKKAERERDIRQVPTLMSEHQAGTKRRKMQGAVLGAAVICTGLALWMAFLLRPAPNPPAPSPATVDKETGPTGPKTVQPGGADSYELPSSNTESRRGPEAGPVPVVPRGMIPGPSRNPSSAGAIDAANLRQIAEWMAAAPQQDRDEAEDIPVPATIRRQPPHTEAPRSATKAEDSVAKGSAEKTVTLKEALNEMTLSVLVFDESKADRMVFINGRKYVEGDLVEDLYLLESITLDGAVLTYGGDRALLKPKAK